MRGFLRAIIRYEFNVFAAPANNIFFYQLTENRADIKKWDVYVLIQEMKNCNNTSLFNRIPCYIEMKYFIYDTEWIAIKWHSCRASTLFASFWKKRGHWSNFLKYEHEFKTHIQQMSYLPGIWGPSRYKYIESYQHRDSHYIHKTVSRPSHFHNGNPISGALFCEWIFIFEIHLFMHQLCWVKKK